MNVIDCHVHIYPDEIAKKIIPRIEQVYSEKARYPGTLESLVSAMEKGGVSKALVLSSVNRPEHVISFNDWCISLNKEQENLFFFGAMHPLFEGFEPELERLKKEGILGVKLQPNAQRFYPDDESVYPLYEKLSSLKMGLAFHAGDEAVPFDPLYAHTKRFKALIDSFPDLNIQLAHLGGYQTWDHVSELMGYGNLWFDSAYCPGNMPDERFVSLAADIGLERILFGSDFPWKDPGEEKEKLRKILGEDAEKVLSENPEKYISLLDAR